MGTDARILSLDTKKLEVGPEENFFSCALTPDMLY